MINPYQKSVAEIAEYCRTDIHNGLSTQEARKRLDAEGPNEIPEVEQKTIFSIFLSQFASPLIYILIAAAVILFFVGSDKIDSFIITGVLFFNAIIGTIQEGRTYSIVQSLKRFIKARCIVIRDGKQQIIDEEHLVVGDLIVLQAGERIPADARVVQAHQLEIDESMLTGESVSVIKQTESLPQENLQIGDQTNMVFKGTYILAGIGRAIVTATGINTQVGQIHKSVEEIKTDIPLKHELKRLSWLILIFLAVICLVLFAIGLLLGRSSQELIVMLTALFICVIPEGLPIVLTLVLVRGAYSMAQQKVVAKNLQGVEGLGRTEVIVTDKTGTLTRNEMIVTQVMAAGGYYHVTGEGYHPTGHILKDDKEIDPATISDEDLRMIGLAGVLLDTTQLSYNKKLGIFDIKGDPTQASLGIFGQKLGFSKEKLREYKEIYEIPFDSLRRFQAGFYQYQSKGYGFFVGAPELLIQGCVNNKSIYEKALSNLLDKGLRVVAVGMIQFDVSTWDPKAIQQFADIAQKDLKLLGLCGIQDAIRPDVAKSVLLAQNAGLKVVMATGDHKATALFVARNVGIFKKDNEIIEGSVFDKMSDEELLAQLHKISVFARVNPHHKVRIIELFHKQALVVAMTGDGVNDVPSLVAADLGIAMGGIGTEVAKQAADLVLLDDSFSNIINGIREGRHIFYTLRRVILYFFSTNLAEILVVFFALFTSLPLPLLASQILWLNFVTDGFLDIGLSCEPQEKGLLSPTWIQRKLRLIDRSLFIKMIYMALPMSLGTLAIFMWYYGTGHESLEYARTMGLLTLIMYQWFNAWNCRSERLSIFQLGIFSNRWFIVAALFVFFLQVCLIYLPWMQFIFKTVPIAFHDWIIVIAITLPIIILEELRKLFMRQYVP